MSNKAWSEEDEQELVKMYTMLNEKDTLVLAEYFGKPKRSIVSKLVQLRIYEVPSKNKDKKSRTVKTMLRQLETILEIEIEGTNLNKKKNLTQLVEAVERMFNNLDVNRN